MAKVNENSLYRLIAPNGDAIYVNVGGYGDMKIPHNARLWGSHPAVQQHPELFMELETPKELLREVPKASDKPILTEVPAPKPTEKQLNEETVGGTISR